MVTRNSLISSSLTAWLMFGCTGLVEAPEDYSQQVVQETNVAQLLRTAQTSKKVEDLFNQGNKLLESRRYEEAIATYDKLLSLKPDRVDAWNNRGNALTAIGRYQQALESYNKAIALKPSKHESWFNQGNALMTMRKYQQAVASYDKSIAIKPDKDEAWINRGIVLTKLQRYEEAIKSYNQALVLKKDSHQVYYNKACSYALQGEVELATDNLQKAMKIAGNRYRNLAKTDQDFHKVRSDKRFQQLVQ
jgi:tetratricopeptide (TPR) repeat protein